MSDGSRPLVAPPGLIATGVLPIPGGRLRPLAAADAPALLDAFGDAATMRYWSRGPIGSLAEMREYLRANLATGTTWCVVPDGTDRAAGWVSLLPCRPGQAELGMILAPAWQRRGLGPAAVAALVDFGFGPGALRRIHADTDPDNAPAHALLERVGFVREGRLRANWVTHIGVRDSVIFGLLPGDSRPA